MSLASVFSYKTGYSLEFQLFERLVLIQHRGKNTICSNSRKSVKSDKSHTVVFKHLESVCLCLHLFASSLPLTTQYTDFISNCSFDICSKVLMYDTYSFYDILLT